MERMCLQILFAVWPVTVRWKELDSQALRKVLFERPCVSFLQELRALVRI